MIIHDPSRKDYVSVSIHLIRCYAGRGLYIETLTGLLVQGSD